MEGEEQDVGVPLVSRARRAARFRPCQPPGFGEMITNDVAGWGAAVTDTSNRSFARRTAGRCNSRSTCGLTPTRPGVAPGLIAGVVPGVLGRIIGASRGPVTSRRTVAKRGRCGVHVATGKSPTHGRARSTTSPATTMWRTPARGRASRTVARRSAKSPREDEQRWKMTRTVHQHFRRSRRMACASVQVRKAR